MLVGVGLLMALLVLRPSSGTANHPRPDPDWGYIYTIYDFYPSNNWPGWGGAPYRDHNLRYRVCTSLGSIGDYAAWDWTTHRFGFNAQSTLTRTRVSNCGVGTDALFWIVDDATMVARCGYLPSPPYPPGSIPDGCFDPEIETYDSYLGRHEVTSATMPIRQATVGGYGQAYQIHVFEHELGHGFGLADHGTTNCSSTVMGDWPPCGNWVGTADIATARCVYIYAC